MKCTKCGVVGGCDCLFSIIENKPVCGVCSGKATMEKVTEIKHLQQSQGIILKGENMAVKSVVAKQMNGQAKAANAAPKPAWRLEEGFIDSHFTDTDSINQLIPKIFHWVWVGNKPFPEKDKTWLQSWRTHHPDWRFVIWCEHPENVEVEGFETFPLPPLVNRTYFYEMEKKVIPREAVASRSDLVRYEIIARYGGIYLDSDVECFRPINELLNEVRLFVCDEALAQPGNYMFGAVPNHPALWTVARDASRELASKQHNINATGAIGPPYLNSKLRWYPDLVIFPYMLFNPLHGEQDYQKVELWPKCSYGNHHYDGKWYDRVKKPVPPEFLK